MLCFVFDELPTDAQTKQFVRWCLQDAGVDADESVVDFIGNLLSDSINTAYQLGHDDAVSELKEETIEDDAVSELKEETIEDDKPAPAHTPVTIKPKWSMP